MKDKNSTSSNALSIKKNAGWFILFLAIASLSIYAVTAQNEGFSLSDFGEYILDSDPIYISLALLSMLGFILFEGLAVITICRSVGYARRIRDGFVYSSADICLSAITPSASGGQPASIWFMMKDGIPATISVVSLVANLAFYTISISVIGTIAFICAPDLLSGYSVASQILIISGYVILTLLAVLFVLILFKEKLVYSVASGVIKLLVKLKLVKNPDKLNYKLGESMKLYKECSEMILKSKRVMAVALLFNLMQRALQITVTLLVYLSSGGEISKAGQVWFAQAFTVVGANCIPIPGAMGVSDYLLLDGFSGIMTSESAVHLALLSRALSFYSMVLICGMVIAVKYVIITKNKLRHKEISR